MNKIYVFLIIIPFSAILLIKSIALYEYDTKQRYLKDQVDNIAYKVKITGILTAGELNDFKDRLSGLGDFTGEDCIVLKQGAYVNGVLSNMAAYTPGVPLRKGDAFVVYIKSETVSNYSRIQNGGVNLDPDKNIYYKAKAQCRVEVFD